MRSDAERHSWLIGARTVLDLLAEHGTLERAAPHLLHAIREQPDLDKGAEVGALRAYIGKLVEKSTANDQQRFSELQIARHIQTAILPRDLSVDGLEVAAIMVPATEVGGDYYDVLPAHDGAWFGIGDVTGHGVGAGMIMLMVQSAVAALIRTCNGPRDVVIELNALLHDNIHGRLRERDHVTFSLLRYTRDGLVRFAGAHEDMIVWRAQSRRCEVIETNGLWLGAVASVAEQTKEEQLQLAPGDILVLYTDGVTEARNAEREQFGLDRLRDLVVELAPAGQPIAQLCDAIVGKVVRWGTQADDISVVVARYHGDDIDYDIDSDSTAVQMGDL